MPPSATGSRWSTGEVRGGIHARNILGPVKHTYFMKSIVCVWHNVPVSGLYHDFTGKTDKQTNKTVKKWKTNTDNIFDFFKTLDDMFGQ